MKIDKDTVATIHYTVSADGQVVDSSQGGEPLEYLHGRGRIIPGLEQGLEQREPGERFDLTVPPAEGYGDYQAELDVELQRDLFPADAQDSLESGMRFRAEHPMQPGRPAIFTITAIEDGTVKATANHPLAGEVLKFDVSVESVREATAEEVEHGHAH